MEQNEKPSIAPIVVDGITYRLLDFENEWTLRHDERVLKLYREKVYSKYPKGDFTQLSVGEQADISLSVDLDADILGLIFKEESEPVKFNEDTYQLKVEIMKDAPSNENVRAAIENFFTLKGWNILNISQTYFPKVNPV